MCEKERECVCVRERETGGGGGQGAGLSALALGYGYMVEFSISEQLLSRKVERFRGWLVFKARRLLYHSTPGSRVIKKQEKARCARTRLRVQGRGCRVYLYGGDEGQAAKAFGHESAYPAPDKLKWCLAHAKHPPRRTLHWSYAQDLWSSQGGGFF